MYVLFNVNDDFSCGTSDKVLPFTSGIFIDNIEEVTKEEIITTDVLQKNARGEQLYLNKDKAITTTITDTPFVKTFLTTVTTDILHKPNIFNKIDVMKAKKQQILKKYNRADCLLYEFNLNNFIDVKYSEKCIAGKNDILLLPTGIVRTTAIDVKNGAKCTICVDSSSPLTIFYSFNGDNLIKYKKEFTIEGNKLYLYFKNASQAKIKLYAYQILM